MSWREDPFDNMWRDVGNFGSDFSERLFNQFHGKNFLPGVRGGMLPALRGHFRIDVREEGDEVLVIADLPGVEKEFLIIELINPRTLAIKCDQTIDRENEDKGYYVRERMYGTMQRMIPLPCEVTDEGATSTFKNGVLEVHLKKISQPARIEIKTD